MTPTVLILILATICFCALIANRIKIAAPIAFLAGGALLALSPNMPRIHIEPEYMLLIFLPPILMEAAFFTSIRDFKADLRAILLLAVGLVVVSAVAVGALFTALVPGATWALGMVLGAIISPPDAAAATSAIKGITLPKRIVSILEGESLVNDASGIVIYKLAVGAVMLGTFSLVDASSLLLWKIIGGIAIGLVIAYVFVRLYPYLRDPTVEILTTFVPPYAAFIIAEESHMSGVLAVVAAGLYIGWHAPKLFTPRMRLPAESVWKIVVFFLNALAFLIIGLQLPELIGRLGVIENPMIISLALAVCVLSVLVRFAWVFTMAYGLRVVLNKMKATPEPLPSWQNVFVVGWTGMRGVVTLALALAIPLTLPDGTAFPHRDLIIFLSVSVIVFTLVLQGLTLPWLTRVLSLTFDPKRMEEEWHARAHAAREALARLDELKSDSSVHLPALARIHEHYTERLESLGDGPNTPLHPDHAPGLMSHPLLQAENRLWAEVLKKEREALIKLRRDYVIGDDVLYDILREMDLLAARFHHEESHSEVSSLAENANIRRTLWCRMKGIRLKAAA
jgi:monovalent cation/hydrogen antiporter